MTEVAEDYPLPSNVGLGKVSGRLGLLVGNIEPTPSRDPEMVALSGEVVFQPSHRGLRNATAQPAPIIGVPSEIRCKLDPWGYLLDPAYDVLDGQVVDWKGDPVTEEDLDSVRGVILVATNDEDQQPVNWTWRVSFEFDPLTGAELQPFMFALPEGTEVDLAGVMKTNNTPGEELPLAQANAAAAASSAYDAAQSADEAASHADDAAGSASDAEDVANAALDRSVVAATFDENDHLILVQEDGSEIDVGIVYGAQGDSAYDVAVEEGFSGSQQEWLDSLVGEKGAPGGLAAEPTEGLNGALTIQATTGIADTGGRDVSAEWPAGGLTVNQAHARRWGPVVNIGIEVDTTGMSTGDLVATITSGFLPAGTYFGLTDRGTRFNVSPATGAIRIWAQPYGGVERFDLMWLTDDAWPDTDPGTPLDGS